MRLKIDVSGLRKLANQFNPEVSGGSAAGIDALSQVTTSGESSYSGGPRPSASQINEDHNMTQYGGQEGQNQ